MTLLTGRKKVHFGLLLAKAKSNDTSVSFSRIFPFINRPHSTACKAMTKLHNCYHFLSVWISLLPLRIQCALIIAIAIRVWFKLHSPWPFMRRTATVVCARCVFWMPFYVDLCVVVFTVFMLICIRPESFLCGYPSFCIHFLLKNALFSRHSCHFFDST